MERSSTRRLMLCIALVLLAISGAMASEDFMQFYLQAQDHDPSYRQARLQRDISVQGLREVRAGSKPFVTLSADVTKVYQDIRRSDNILFTQGKSDFVDQLFELSLNQPIYRADVFRQIPQGHAQVRRAEAALAAAEQELMIRLSEAVMNGMAARDILEFAAAERTAIEQQVEESQQRLGAGLANITDLHDAQARYEDAVAREIEAGDGFREALLIIGEITGTTPADVGVLGETFPLIAPDPPEPDAWVKTALFRNHRLESLGEEVEVARQEVRVQKAARLPSLNLVASYRGSETGGSVFLGGGGSEIFSGNIGLQLGIPIYNGGLWSSRTSAAMLQHEVVQQDLERERGRLERETRVAFQGVVSGITRVQALQRAVFSQERALESTEESFRSGLATGRAVLDSRRDLFFALRDHSLARYVYVLSTLRLKQASGALGLEDMRRLGSHIR